MNWIMTDKDLNFIRSITPVKLLSRPKGRRRAKLLFCDFKFVGTSLQIVLHRPPRNRKVFLTEAKETAKGQNCVGNLAGQLVDHHALDNPDLFARRSANRRSLDTIACDQVVSHGVPPLNLHGAIIGLSRLLRACPERPRRRRAAEQRDERAAFHSITSSASASSLSGML